MESDPGFWATLKEHQDDYLCDFEINCDGSRFKVHRLVLSMHSGYFKRLCKSGFKESQERKITLHEDPPLAVKLMVEYFYTFDYNLEPSMYEGARGRPFTALECHSWMFAIADKYDVEKLKGLVYDKFEFLLYNQPETARRKAADIIAVVPHIYRTAPANDRRLRKRIVSYLAATSLLKFAESGALKALLAEVPEFASDLVIELVG